MKEIRDQGSCGSCWAFGAVEAMSDRICVKTGKNIEISAEDLLSCCDECGMGCEGGWPAMAWDFWEETGLVTGGKYHTHGTCRPYTIAECSHHVNDPDRKPCGDLEDTPECKKRCESDYKTEYQKDKRYGVDAEEYSGEVEIQMEIMKNGPVEGMLMVYSDFLQYKSGND